MCFGGKGLEINFQNIISGVSQAVVLKMPEEGHQQHSTYHYRFYSAFHQAFALEHCHTRETP